MLWIPRKAWPALARFAPEKFPALQLRFEALELGSEERRSVDAELEQLVDEFRTWAKAFVAQERQLELLGLEFRERLDRRTAEEFLAPRMNALARVDLTVTEFERLRRLQILQNPNRTRSIEDALKALAKPWRYREPSLGL